MIRMTESKIENLHKGLSASKRINCGFNLYVQVSPKGAKSFIYRKRVGQAAYQRGLGVWPTIAVDTAYAKALEYNQLLAAGEHLPTAIKRSAAQGLTWIDAAKKYLDQRKDISARRVKQIYKRVITDMTNEFNNRPIHAIDKAHIKAAILPFWDMATAKERLANMAAVWYFGVSEIDADIPVSSKMDEIKSTLPKNAKREKIHFGQLSFADLQKWLAGLAGNNAMPQRDKVAVEIVLLTNKRPSEVLRGEWHEIDFDNATWTIPSGRLKMGGDDHVMPLSSRVIELLKSWRQDPASHRQHVNGDFVFSANGKKGHISNDTLNNQLDKFYPLGTATNGGKAVVHGTSRGTFKTWSRDQLDADQRYVYENDAVELQLAHAVGNEVERAYNTANGMTMRRKLVEDYSVAARALC